MSLTGILLRGFGTPAKCTGAGNIIVGYSLWPKWIHASITELIREVMAPHGLPVYADTDPVPTEPANRIQFSWTGPDIEETSKDQYRLYVTLNLLVTTVKTDGNAYQQFVDQGLGQEALPACIPVYKYGDDPSTDDETQLGLLVRQGRVNTLLIGHQDLTNRIRQTGFITNYRMDLGP